MGYKQIPSYSSIKTNWHLNFFDLQGKENSDVFDKTDKFKLINVL